MGVQARAKTSTSVSTANNILKKIEIYKTINSVYPSFNELKNNYAPGATVAGGAGAEAKLDNQNAIISAGLAPSSALNGTIIQYNDCSTGTVRNVVYWDFQINNAVNAKNIESC